MASRVTATKPKAMKDAEKAAKDQAATPTPETEERTAVETTSTAETTPAATETTTDAVDEIIAICESVTEALGDESATTYEKFLNCKEFKLREVLCKGEKGYRLSFTADNLHANTEYKPAPESSEECPFDSVLGKIKALAFPIVFPDQGPLKLISIKRKIVNNKHKQPEDKVEFAAESVGSPYTVKSDFVTIHSLGDKFIELFNELENYSREELTKKKTQTEQMNLFESDEESEDE